LSVVDNNLAAVIHWREVEHVQLEWSLQPCFVLDVYLVKEPRFGLPFLVGQMRIGEQKEKGLKWRNREFEAA